MKKTLFYFFALNIISTSLFSSATDSVSFYLNNYQPNEALKLIEQQLDLGSVNAGLFYLKARAHKDLFEISDAIIAVKKSIAHDSVALNSWFLLADLYDLSGNTNNGINAYKKILDKDSTNMQAHFRAGNLYMKQENYLNAVTHFGKIVVSDTSNWYALRRLTRCYEKLQAPVQYILPMYNKVLELNPDDRITKNRICMILLGENKYRDVVEFTNNLLQNDSLNTKLLGFNGYAYIQLQEKDSAITSLMKCIELNDTSFFVHKYLGLSYYNKRDYDSSIFYLEKAYAVNNTDPHTVYYLGSSCGRLYYKQKGIDYLKEAIELLSPDEEFLSKSYAELGRTYESFYKPREAGEAYNMAYEYNNRNTDLYYLMGTHYYKKNNELARKYLTMYIDSTLAQGDNSSKTEYYRLASTRILDKIKEDKFWNEPLKEK